MPEETSCDFHLLIWNAEQLVEDALEITGDGGFSGLLLGQHYIA